MDVLGGLAVAGIVIVFVLVAYVVDKMLDPLLSFLKTLFGGELWSTSGTF